MPSLSVTVFILIASLNLSLISTETTIGFTSMNYGPNNITFRTDGTHILIENEPFTIKISSFMKLNHLNCMSISRNIEIYKGVVYSVSGYYYVTKSNAVPEMGGTWKCEVTSSNVQIDFTFPVHIRTQGVGGIYINNKTTSNELTNTSVTEYDEIGQYNFIDGEISKFTCKSWKPGNVTMVYNNKGHKIVIPGLNKNSSSIFLKLTSESNGTYLDCQVNVQPNNDLSTIRIYLNKRTSDVDYRRFKINNQVLLPVNTTIERLYNLYTYEYFDGERVDIATMVDYNKYDSMKCKTKGDHIPEELVDLNYAGDIKDIRRSIVLRKANNMLRIECSVYVKPSLRATMKNNPVDNIAVQFICYDERSEMDFNPVIIGLPWSHILSKFKKYDNLGFIHYEYKNNEALKLRCLPKNNENAEWSFNETEVTSSIITERLKNKPETRTFTLNETFNRTKIVCYTGTRTNRMSTTRVVLVRWRKDLTKKSPFKESFKTGNDSKSGLASDEDDSDDGDSNEIIYITIGVLLAAIIISLALWIIVTLYKRRQKAEQASLINHENLPEHNNGPMPIPRQWQSRDEPIYSLPVDVNIEAMYTKPIPKQPQPKQVSEIYSEIQYAEPELTEESPYAEIMLKETGNAVAQDNPNLQYANIEFDSQNGSDIKQFPEKAIYTEIMPVNSVKKKDDKYENAFDNQRYANFHSQRDFIEPTYCEM